MNWRNNKMTDQKNHIALVVRCTIMLCLIIMGDFLCPIAWAASNDKEPIRVGYYQNEVFQEGAQPGAIKTGYAYEYYQKLSEYTGWEYEYVYCSKQSTTSILV